MTDRQTAMLSDRNSDHSRRLERSWTENASAWTRAVREGRIESRKVATDQAILGAVLDCRPERVLDVGCGEGWLARALAEDGISVVGIDASSPLIDAATALGGGEFYATSFDAMAADPTSAGDDFDAIVCNFSLLDEDIEPLLHGLRSVLTMRGRLLIQTSHPWSAKGEGDYRDGWREEVFDGFGADFKEPMPWFFRTLSSWVELLFRAGFQIEQIREPAHPESNAPLSLLLRCSAARF